MSLFRQIMGWPAEKRRKTALGLAAVDPQALQVVAGQGRGGVEERGVDDAAAPEVQRRLQQLLGVVGEAVKAFVSLKPGHAPGAALERELSEAVVKGMGTSYRPRQVLLVGDLPKTRNAKVMRRIIRAAYLGQDPGDTSSLENPQAVNEISHAH